MNDDDVIVSIAVAALRFWAKIHREGLCDHTDGMAWAECEALADALGVEDNDPL